MCATCSGSSTACTSCQPGLYLSQPVTGTCSSSCTNPSYTLKDEVNMVCVASCPSNLKATGSSCVLCSSITPNTYF